MPQHFKFGAPSPLDDDHELQVALTFDFDTPMAINPHPLTPAFMHPSHSALMWPLPSAPVASSSASQQVFVSDIDDSYIPPLLLLESYYDMEPHYLAPYHPLPDQISSFFQSSLSQYYLWTMTHYYQLALIFMTNLIEMVSTESKMHWLKRTVGSKSERTAVPNNHTTTRMVYICIQKYWFTSTIKCTKRDMSQFDRVRTPKQLESIWQTPRWLGYWAAQAPAKCLKAVLSVCDGQASTTLVNSSDIETVVRAQWIVACSIKFANRMFSCSSEDGEIKLDWSSCSPIFQPYYCAKNPRYEAWQHGRQAGCDCPDGSVVLCCWNVCSQSWSQLSAQYYCCRWVHLSLKIGCTRTKAFSDRWAISTASDLKCRKMIWFECWAGRWEFHYCILHFVCWQSNLQELYLTNHYRIHWPSQHNNMCATDLYFCHTTVLDVMNSILSLYKGCVIPPLHKAALACAYHLILLEDENTKYQTLGPVSKTTNLICRAHVKGPGSEVYEQHTI